MFSESPHQKETQAKEVIRLSAWANLDIRITIRFLNENNPRKNTVFSRKLKYRLCLRKAFSRLDGLNVRVSESLRTPSIFSNSFVPVYPFLRGRLFLEYLYIP